MRLRDPRVLLMGLADKGTTLALRPLRSLLRPGCHRPRYRNRVGRNSRVGPSCRFHSVTASAAVRQTLTRSQNSVCPAPDRAER